MYKSGKILLGDISKTPEGAWICINNVAGARTASLIVSFKDGAAYEEDNEWGMAHFLEHINFQGTPFHPSLEKIASAVESLGGIISAFTGKEHVSYFIKMPSEELDRGFKILEEIILNMNFSHENVEKEKKIILEEAALERSKIRFLNLLNLDSLMLFPSPASRYSLGDIDNGLKYINIEDISSYKKRVYNSSNLSITAVGEIDEAKTLKKIENFLKKLPKGSRRKVREAPAHSVDKLSRFSAIPCPGAVNSSFAMGWAFAPEEDLQPPLTIINAMLGIGYSSILYRRLREKEALTYFISTSIKFYHEKFLWSLSLDHREKNIEKITGAINDEITKIAEGRISTEDIAAAGRGYLGRRILAWEDTLELAKWINFHLLKERGKEEIIMLEEKLQEVSAQDLADIAKKYMTSELAYISTAGA